MKTVYTLIATDADGLAESQTPLAGGDLTLDGTLISGGVLTLNTPQPITVASDGNDLGRTFIVTGTDWRGNALTESLTGPNIGTTTGTSHFKTVTSISVDAATAGAITAGVVGTAICPWIPLDAHRLPFSYSYFADIGTATFQIESTLDDAQSASVTPVVNAVVEASGSSDATGASTTICTGLRVKVTAFTSGDITFNLIQG